MFHEGPERHANKFYCAMAAAVLIAASVSLAAADGLGQPEDTSAGRGAPPTPTDYCALLGEDDIQGKKSGFLAGNKVYYVGGKYEVQRCTENAAATGGWRRSRRSRAVGLFCACAS